MQLQGYFAGDPSNMHGRDWGVDEEVSPELSR